jgi:hypothetical protein
MQHTTALSIITLALAAPALAGNNEEPHFDIWLHPEGSAFVVGSITEGTPGEPINDVVRVFAAELGEEPDFPFSAFEPGIQSLPGRATAGATYAFAIPSSLMVWNGEAFEVTDHAMTLDFGPASVTSAVGYVDGFTFTPQPSGLMHIHFDFTLSGPGPEPEPGVYALPIVFAGATPAYEPAPTSWIVFNLGQSEETHDLAIDFAETYLACGIDLSGDGTVDATDIGLLLGAWGTTDAGSDLDGNGEVDASDLAMLLGAWGFACNG